MLAKALLIAFVLLPTSLASADEAFADDFSIFLA
jgi:hypothetical protein